MNTKFPYGQIDFDKYFDAYMETEGAVKNLPSQVELKEQARKGIVKDQIILLELPEGTSAEYGDTLTLHTMSSIAKFNKEKVTVSIGRGLYDKSLENALIGKTVGESVEIMINGEAVRAMILRIQRKSVPEPTDDMVVALKVTNFEGKLLKTVKEYEDFITLEQRMQCLSEVNYTVLEQVLNDYPIESYDADDIRILGQLEKEKFHEFLLERDHIDIYTCSKEEFHKLFGHDTIDEYIAARHEWYQAKIQQCLVILNILGLPCEGKYDPLDHYEVLSELMDTLMNFIEEKMKKL